MEYEIIRDYMKFDEVFPPADLSAFGWIEDAKCFLCRKDKEKRLYCQFYGRYIRFALKNCCVVRAAELDKFKEVLEQQIGYKTDCTGTPEKYGGPFVVYRVADEMPLYLYKKLQKELSEHKAQYEKQATEA